MRTCPLDVGSFVQNTAALLSENAAMYDGVTPDASLAHGDLGCARILPVLSRIRPAAGPMTHNAREVAPATDPGTVRVSACQPSLRSVKNFGAQALSCASIT